MSRARSRARSLDERRVFPILDTLRAVGALAVLTTHTTFQSGDYFNHGIWGSIFARLDVGVAIFFVLSGFLLSRPWLVRARTRQALPPARPYYRKRFWRIYPVYVVTVVIAFALLPENNGAEPVDWLRSLLLADTHTTGKLPHGLTQMWSLSVEVAFYIVLPWLMAAVLHRGLRARRLAVVLVAMVGLTVAWHIWFGPALADHVAGNPMLWLPAFLSWFAVGIGLALLDVHLASSRSPARVARLIREVARHPGVCWTAATGLLLVAATPIGGPIQLLVATTAESVVKNLLYAVIGGLLVMTGVFSVPGQYARTMSAGPLRHLGHISYSMFCIHLPVLTLVMTVTGSELFRANGLQIWSLTLVITLIASELLHRFVEVPCQRWGRRRRVSDETAPPLPPTSAPPTAPRPRGSAAS